MSKKVDCIEIEGDECLSPDEICQKINEELARKNATADDVIDIMQPSSYSVTRVFFRS